MQSPRARGQTQIFPNHSKSSGKQLVAKREDGSSYTPHILEIAFGTDRPTYALIDLFYNKKEGAQGKTTFEIPYHMAPIDVSVFPLLKNKPDIVNLAEKVKAGLEKEFIVDYDFTGSIGRRYLRSSTSGIPFARLHVSIESPFAVSFLAITLAYSSEAPPFVKYATSTFPFIATTRWTISSWL